MLNFVVCDDNINILDKLPKMLESIFIKHGFDASIGFKSDDFDEIINYVDNNKTDVLWILILRMAKMAWILLRLLDVKIKMLI